MTEHAHRHVIKDYRGMSDFERINGVDGVYIANAADVDAEPALTLAGGLQAVSDHGVSSCACRCAFLVCFCGDRISKELSDKQHSQAVLCLCLRSMLSVPNFFIVSKQDMRKQLLHKCEETSRSKALVL